jgi:peptide/nickel transport system substrate-binding protein
LFNENKAVSRTVFAVIAVVVVILATIAGYITTQRIGPRSESISSGSFVTTPSLSYSNSTLNVQVSQSFGTLDPAVGTDYTQMVAMINLYDDLVTQSPNGSIQPEVAKSWVVSNHGKTYTFIINSNIRFHNGVLMNSSDIVFSMQRMLAIKQGYSSLWTGVLNSSGVVALNSTAVQFRLVKPYAPFLGTLSLFFIVNKELVMQHLANVTSSNPMGDWGYAWMQTNDAGSGPYMLQSWQRGVALTLERFVGYWQGWEKNPDPFNFVTFHIITSDATVLSLAKDGQLDWVSFLLAYPTYLSLKNMGWNFTTYSSANIWVIKMNTERAPMNNIWLRRAIINAFNYSAIQYILPGAAALAGPLPSNNPYYDTSIKPPTQNITLAKEMLAKSGLNASSLHITIMYITGLIFEQDIALEFQKDLQQLGITVSIQPETFETYTQLATSNQTTPDASIVGYIPFYPDPDTYFYPIYDSASKGTWTSMEWIQNSAIDNLISQERSTLNQTLREKIFYQLQEDIVNLSADVFLYSQPYYVALSPAVGGYVYYLGQSFDYNMYHIYNKG